MTKTPVATKGTSIKVGVNQTEIKAILISDLNIDPGEAAVVKTSASDGSKYSLAGDEGESLISGDVLVTKEDFVYIMDSIYGTGSLVGSTTTWNMQDAGNTVNNLSIVTPTIGTGLLGQVSFTLVNGKGLTAKPLFQLEKHWAMSLKYTGDYITASYNSNA